MPTSASPSDKENTSVQTADRPSDTTTARKSEEAQEGTLVLYDGDDELTESKSDATEEADIDQVVVEKANGVLADFKCKRQAYLNEHHRKYLGFTFTRRSAVRDYSSSEVAFHEPRIVLLTWTRLKTILVVLRTMAPTAVVLPGIGAVTPDFSMHDAIAVYKVGESDFLGHFDMEIRFDFLFALTYGLWKGRESWTQELSPFLLAEMNQMFEGMANHWTELLHQPEELIGIDMEFSVFGVLALLQDLKQACDTADTPIALSFPLGFNIPDYV